MDSMSWRKEIPLGGNSFPSVQLSAGEQWAPFSQDLSRVGRARPVFSIEESKVFTPDARGGENY